MTGGPDLVVAGADARLARTLAQVSAPLVEWLAEIAGALYQGGDQSLGDALRIGGGLGAVIGYLDAYQGHGADSYLPGNGLLPAFGLAYLAAGDVARRRTH